MKLLKYKKLTAAVTGLAFMVVGVGSCVNLVRGGNNMFLFIFSFLGAIISVYIKKRSESFWSYAFFLGAVIFMYYRFDVLANNLTAEQKFPLIWILAIGVGLIEWFGENIVKKIRKRKQDF